MSKYLVAGTLSVMIIMIELSSDVVCAIHIDGRHYYLQLYIFVREI